MVQRMLCVWIYTVQLKLQFYQSVTLFQSLLRWIIGAAVVNAFYSPNRNQIGEHFTGLNEATGSLCDQ